MLSCQPTNGCNGYLYRVMTICNQNAVNLCDNWLMEFLAIFYGVTAML